MTYVYNTTDQKKINKKRKKQKKKQNKKQTRKKKMQKSKKPSQSFVYRYFCIHTLCLLLLLFSKTVLLTERWLIWMYDDVRKSNNSPFPYYITLSCALGELSCLVSYLNILTR